VEKVVTLVTGRDVATSGPAAGAERRLGRQRRFAEMRDAHKLRWSHLWERLSIEFEYHADELRILRLHLFHLLQTISYNSEDLDIGVPARGLHGEAYRGAHLLGRAVHLPGAEPAAADHHPFAVAVPV